MIPECDVGREVVGDPLAEVIDDVDLNNATYILTRDNKPVAVLIPVQAYDRLREAAEFAGIV